MRRSPTRSSSASPARSRRSQVGQAEHVRHRRPAGHRAEAQERVDRYREIARSTTGASPPERAAGARPRLVRRADARRPTCRADSTLLDEEIFGPLLTVEAVDDVDEALRPHRRASAIALTGGLFARNPRTVDEVARRTPVGNLYVNRAITGAMVGRQPFGGNRLSGTGTKAGGPDYLLHFVEPRVVTENTVRHGLVVD